MQNRILRAAVFTFRGAFSTHNPQKGLNRPEDALYATKSDKKVKEPHVCALTFWGGKWHSESIITWDVYVFKRSWALRGLLHRSFDEQIQSEPYVLAHKLGDVHAVSQAILYFLHNEAHPMCVGAFLHFFALMTSSASNGEKCFSICISWSARFVLVLAQWWRHTLGWCREEDAA